MLTRLRIHGFKNLVDVEVCFGPFTCIAGTNGVGKSNLFDAIHFLSASADQALVEAAHAVRSDGGRARSGDIQSLFTRVGETFLTRMSFEVDMIIPRDGVDDLGQQAIATSTFLRYCLDLVCADADRTTLEIEKEHLSYITKGDAREQLPFPHSREWLDSVVFSTRRGTPFISTDGEGVERVIKLHQEGGPGRARQHQAARLPRTVLSSATAADGATVAMVRNELRSWRQLQLEPTALRRSDDFGAPRHLGADGSHLPATLARLASGPDSENVYRTVCNRLKDLIDDIHDIRVDRDERRELLSIIATNRDGTIHPARSLSDGTLRFLALAVIGEDPESKGVICLEEPENGIHPERVDAMLRLLAQIAVDPEEQLATDNPLRQVIINTHSPAVVSTVSADDILVAQSRIETINGTRTRGVEFSAVPNTWRQLRAQDPTTVQTCSISKLMSYLSPAYVVSEGEGQRLSDRDDVRKYLNKMLQLPLPYRVEER